MRTFAWQLTLGRRSELDTILAEVRPKLAIAVGSVDSDALDRIAGVADEVHAFARLAAVPAEAAPANVKFHLGDKSTLISKLLAELAEVDRNVDFVCVEGAGSSEEVQRDIDQLLDSAAVCETTILIADGERLAQLAIAGSEDHATALHHAAVENARLLGVIESMRVSPSWRVTRPLRAIKKLVKTAAGGKA